MVDYTFYPGIAADHSFPPAVRQAIADADELKNYYATKSSLTTKADLVGGLVPTSQLPSLALTETYPVANRAAMLALTTTQVQKGDVAVITGQVDRGSYILSNSDPSSFANWILLNSPTDVVTLVNGQMGTVVLGKADVGLSNADNTSDANKPISTATQTALDTKATLIENVFVVAASGSAVTLAEPSAYGVNDITLTAAPVAITFPPLPAAGKSKTLLVILRQDATGARTVTWPANVKWPGGYTTVLSNNANKADVISFSSYDGVSWYGFPGGLGF